jgi:site-specific DNA-methyltransferase (adenine-specific)
MKNQVFLMDCMEYMKTIEDNYYDLSICDPPYSEACNLHGGSSKNKTHGWGDNWVSGKHEIWNVRPPKEYFDELFRISKNQIIWGGNYFINDLKDTSCFLIWDKGQRNFSLADAEMAWTSFKKPVRIFEYSRAENNKTNRIHICQKPVALYKWVLTNYAKQNDKIFDSHVGSGSSRIACYELGFDFIGCELDKDYFEAQEKRFMEFKKKFHNEFYIPDDNNSLFKDFN